MSDKRPDRRRTQSNIRQSQYKARPPPTRRPSNPQRVIKQSQRAPEPYLRPTRTRPQKTISPYYLDVSTSSPSRQDYRSIPLNDYPRTPNKFSKPATVGGVINAADEIFSLVNPSKKQQLDDATGGFYSTLIDFAKFIK